MRERFLTKQPYAAEMTPDKSLYDLAARVFAATQIMLREHFRCVPPIIAYSNRTFYKGQIQPLRIPRASERIEPPLVDIFVEGGTRDRHDCNHLEAEAIADEINAILADEKLKGRTIGVVSLLGGEQAKHIDSVVSRKCDVAELHRRKFLCGDARTFQGSERHIMFLSLVVDSANCKAVSGNMFDQRFNVAASRAQDRMYLVRSVQPSDLSEKDLRSGLLAHFDNPLVVDKAEAEVLIDRCESGFEKQVYSELVSRGYRVTPQVKTGAYRIDMVVEGSNDLRLAIECDGDEFHGADRWQHDMNRQRVLERAGWMFWRCFASTWTLRKDEVIEELTQYLDRMGIEPVGAIERASRLVEKRVWKDATSVEPSHDLNSRQSGTGSNSHEISTEDGRHFQANPSEPEDRHSKRPVSTERAEVRVSAVARPKTEVLPAGATSGNGKVGSDSVSRIADLKAQDWFSIAKWSKENDCLENWQRRFAFTLGVHVNRGNSITDRQRPHAERIFEEVLRLGYKPATK